jgi:hypothetical protein
MVSTIHDNFDMSDVQKNKYNFRRERPFNLKGWGGYGFFLKKYSDSQCCWKKYSDFGGGKKKSDSEFLSYNLMLNFGK